MEFIYIAEHKTDEQDNWDILGVFDNEQKAVEFCYDDNCFVMKLLFNQFLGKALELEGYYL